MPNGRLKVLDTYTKVNNLSRYLVNKPELRDLYNKHAFGMQFISTQAAADANKVYNSTQNGNYSEYSAQTFTALKRNFTDFYTNFLEFQQKYMDHANSTGHIDRELINMVNDLSNDLEEDRAVLNKVKLTPGKSFMESVYEAQNEIFNGPEEQELPGQDEVERVDYPGQNTLYNGGREDDAPAPVQNQGISLQYPDLDLPGQDTVLRHQGNLGGPAVQPYEQQQFYGDEQFYQNMNIPSENTLRNQFIHNRRGSERHLQIWTVAPLTNSLVDSLNGPQKEEMLKINGSMMVLFNTIRPFNPAIGEEPRMPSARDVNDIQLKYKMVYQSLNEFRNKYVKDTKNPSDQVLFTTDNIMKKLMDDFMVFDGINLGQETVPQAAHRLLKLPKHFGLESDRKTPLKAPQRKAEMPAPAPAAAHPTAPKKLRTDEEVRRAVHSTADKVNKLAKMFDDADPGWMLTSSDKYSEVKKNLEKMQKWYDKNVRAFGPDADKSSPKYKEALNAYKGLINHTMASVEEYLDKKNDDFHKDPLRRDDPSNQKWEQLRVRTNLHAFDELREIQRNMGIESTLGDRLEKKMEEYKDTLMSEASKAIYADRYGKEKEAPTAQPGPAPQM